MGSSEGSSNYSADFFMPADGPGGKGDLKAGGEWAGKGVVALQQQHSRTASEVSSSEVSGSSIGVWERGIVGSITHPSKFPLVLIQVRVLRQAPIVYGAFVDCSIQFRCIFPSILYALTLLL